MCERLLFGVDLTLVILLYSTGGESEVEHSVPQLVQGLAGQKLASLADAVFVIGVRMEDDDPDRDSSVVSPLRLAGQGPDLVAESLPGLPSGRTPTTVAAMTGRRVLVGPPGAAVLPWIA